MFTCRCFTAVVVLAAAFAIVSGSDRSPNPEFARDSGAAAFDSGTKFFKAYAYDQARTQFKKARSAAKSRADRDLVDLWIKATYGGEEFMGCRRLVMRGQHREAYDELMEAYPEYIGTPIEDELKVLWKSLSNRVSTVLEGFDSHREYYDKKPGREVVEEPERVLRGIGSLIWKSGHDKKEERLTLRRVPQDWSGYEEVELWYNARVAPRDMHLELTCGRRGEKDDGGKHKFTTHIRMKGKGWHYLRLPLDRFTSTGSPCLTKVKSAELTILDDRRYEFMLDNIVLLHTE